MKLIIDIPDTYYEYCKAQEDAIEIQLAVKNGIPLDDLRAEIERQERWLMDTGYNACSVDIAFDAIKSVIAESEDKK